ncbi:non-ribosomal peptide synthetase family protein [Phormidium nigroviride]
MKNIENSCIHTLVESQVEQTPNAIAAIFQSEQITYQELNQKANQLAHYLKSLGVNSETLIGVCVDRSLNMLIGLLGVLKAGGAYVPIDPSYPADRIALMLEDSQSPVLITQKHLLENLTQLPNQIVCLDEDWDAISQFSNQNMMGVVSSENLAYTIYTSGSTGKPKGVQILHRAVVNLLLSMQKEPGMTSEDVLLALTTFSFDLSVPDLFLPLIVGATQVIVSREVASDANQLAKAIAESGATFIQATPATWRMLLAIGWQGKPDLKIICGGEAMTRTLANQLLERCATLWNMYGPTETTVWSTVSRIKPGNSSISIGSPILNTKIYVIRESARGKNNTLQSITEGEGELYIGGLGLARGYLNRPDLTSEKFVKDPFSEDPTARLYKTGDLVHYLADGNIAIIGRIDSQVKIFGHRIELGDIETTLLQHSAVQECVVVVREDSPEDRRLVAYLVLKSRSSKLHPVEIGMWLKDKLPKYMVPTIIVFLDALPLTPNAKVNRQALPVPNLNILEEIVPPRTELEEQLTRIWTSVLGIEVGIYQNFFESGGNSLLSAVLLSRIRETLEVEISLEYLFKANTIAGLAEVIEAVQAYGSTVKFDTTPAELWADAILDEKICTLNINSTKTGYMFLTGATGFIGAFLLQELLHQNPQSTIYCLIRANSTEEASQRLRKNLENYQIWREEFGSRIVPVVGDLSKPLFGLSEVQFSELAERLEVIYHCGAYVNLVYPYIALRDVNVGGTKEVLRLAVRSKTIPVHHISTLDVFQSSNYENRKLILETDALLGCEGARDGYAQSKWVAEKLVMAARDRGVPVSIYRLGMVTGHSQTGAFQLNNMICRMIKGFIQMGSAPEMEMSMNLAPVDYVVKAIYHLSCQPKAFEQSFHILSPSFLSIKQLVADINLLGYPVPSIPYQNWQVKLLNTSPENALTPMASLFIKKISNQEKTFIETTPLALSHLFDTANTKRGLSDTNIICPTINSTVLKAYLSYFVQLGFLPQPI